METSRAEEIGLHDNWIYAHEVDHDARVIVLHTFFPHSTPPEFTDVIFEDVLVHHFQKALMTVTRPPSNVLFDIEPGDPSSTLKPYWSFLFGLRQYLWPVSGWMGSWNTLEELAAILTSEGHQCFHVHGSFGLEGFVFARRMIVRARADRWARVE